MKTLKTSLFTLLTLLTGVEGASWEFSGMGFYYGSHVPVDELSQFEWVILEPAHVDREQLKIFKERGSVPISYLSLGEVNSKRAFRAQLPKELYLDKNSAWESHVVDLSHPEWRTFILSMRIPELLQKGFQGIFLDTLDSYKLSSLSKKQQAFQQQALEQLILSIRKKFPKLKIVLNRGFELLPKVGKHVDGLVAESLFRGYNLKKKKYQAVTAGNRIWLKNQLLSAKRKFGFPVCAIDYVPSDQRELARKTAQQISDLDLIPWVTDKDLFSLGMGLVEVVPRKVIVIHDTPLDVDVAETSAHLLKVMPLEYLGLTAEIHNVRSGLPQYHLKGRVAGILTSFEEDKIPHAPKFRKWIERQIDSKVPVIFCRRFGFPIDDAFLSKLGLRQMTRPIRRPVQLHLDQKMVGFESPPRKRLRDLMKLESFDKKNKEHLFLEDSRGRRISLVVTGSWGGIALDPYVLEPFRNEKAKWVVNPFHFFKQSLNLPSFPIPDLTTEYGNRMLLVSIDGDGSASRSELPGAPYAIDVTVEEIFKKYPFPTTASVVEGEMSTEGVYPRSSKELEKIAQEMFKLPHVELATHTFSHPYDWKKVLEHPESKKYRLPIPGYTFDLKRDIDGSIDYINQRLASKVGNPKRVKVVLWSGTALPTHESLKRVNDLGLWNLNGGDTRITSDFASVTMVSPQGRWEKGYYQVFAPVINENVYTNLWTGPFYGFRRVIETFKLTDHPRRLKPIHIYYHFYSGSRLDSLRALKEIYDWAMTQETRPLYVSEFAKKAVSYQSLSLGRHLSGAWQVAGWGDLRTFRVPSSFHRPSFSQSPGLVSFRELPQGRYLSFRKGSPQRLKLTFGNEKKKYPHVVSSNAEVLNWRVQKDGSVKLNLKAHLNIELVVSGMDGPLSIKWREGLIVGKKKGNHWCFSIPSKETGDALLVRS